MRKIEQNMVKALKGWQNWQSANTRVEVNGLEGIRKVFLHNNQIACIKSLGDDRLQVEFASCGWATHTTNSRLNAISDAFNLPVRVGTVKFAFAVYFHGHRLQDASDPFIFECGVRG